MMKRTKWIGLGLVGVILAVPPAVMLMRGLGGGRAEPLPVTIYAENPRNLSGNTYELRARIRSQRGYRDGVGRILDVEPLEVARPVALFVPAGLEGFSPSPGQSYRFGVFVGGDGILEMQWFRKL